MKIELPREKREMVAVLLVAPVLLTLFVYHGGARSLEGLAQKIAGSQNVNYYSTLLQFVAMFLFLFVIPALVTKFLLKRKLKDYGVAVGDWRFGLKLTALAIVLVVVPIVYIGSRFPQVRAAYPLSQSAKNSAQVFIIYQLFYGLSYFGWEFFFRGFMIFGLKDSLGKTAAILISVTPSCIMHCIAPYAKPELETWGSIVVGILFGIACVRARSILYVFTIHWSIGFFNDVFVLFF